MQMIKNIKACSAKLKKKILVYMDLEGPKLRIKTIYHGSKKLKKDKNNNTYVKLFNGEFIALTKNEQAFGGDVAAKISIETPEISDFVNQGESVWFDDGKLGGVVVLKEKNFLLIKLTHVPEEGYKLKSEKGIMFPESELSIPALTKDDLKNLPFIAKHADMVGYSFVQNKEDISKLRSILTKLKNTEIGIILKIETKEAFSNLPHLILEAMRFKNCGVMIARGDLAVAIGYRRIAEVQEEIMWLAEAAHLPVIWATQVLENLAKKGVATRAEVSDAVKSVRAECVMLNKGPFISEVIKMIKDIDKRMAPHEDKKRKFNRQLSVANSFILDHK
jgi:pyruvate kinase